MNKQPSFSDKLKEASTRAIQETLKVCDHIMVIEKGWVIKLYADGSREKVREIKSAKFVSGLKKGDTLNKIDNNMGGDS